MSVSIVASGRPFRSLNVMAAALAAGLAMATAPFALAQDPAPTPAPEVTPAEPAPAAEEPVAPAVPEIDPDAVVAIVEGIEITERDLEILQRFVGDQLGQVPPESIRAVLIEIAVDFKLLALAAEGLELDQLVMFQAEMAMLREQLLREDYIAAAIVPEVTQDDIETAYIAYVAGLDLPEEVLIRHIQVATEAEASDIIRRLEAGEDFATLAFELSLDRVSAEDGGLIDEYWQPGELIQELDDVVFTVQGGTVLPFPIPIGENWHVVKVDERRRQPPPSLEELADSIRQNLVIQAYNARLAELREGADIEIIGVPAAEDAPAGDAGAREGAAPAETPAPGEGAAVPDEDPAPPAEGADAANAGGAEPIMVAGDAAAGEALAGQCAGCHTFEEGAPNVFGPNLFGVVGRPVGGVEGFAYSPALQALYAEGATWSLEFLDAFIESPHTAAPGTTMPFAGIADASARANLIAYLATLTAE